MNLEWTHNTVKKIQEQRNVRSINKINIAMEWVSVYWTNWMWPCETHIKAYLCLLTHPRTTILRTQMHFHPTPVVSASRPKQKPATGYVNRFVMSACYRLCLPNIWRGLSSFTWAARRCSRYPGLSASPASGFHHHHTGSATGKGHKANQPDYTGSTIHHLSQTNANLLTTPVIKNKKSSTSSI